MNFAEKFKVARKNAGITQKQIADELGLDRSAIAKYEQGVSKPNYKNLVKICKMFNVSVEEFMNVDF